MIKLTQINGEVFVLNAELIRYVEGRPDTFVTLTTGERLLVRESMDTVMERAVRYQQSKYLIPAPAATGPAYDALKQLHPNADYGRNQTIPTSPLP